jgi:hypothetical protein
VWTSPAPSWDRISGTCRQKNLAKLAKNGTCAPGSGGECGSSLPPAETHPEGALRWLGRLEAGLVANGSETAVALAVELAGEWQPDEQSDFVWLMRRSEITWPRANKLPRSPVPGRQATERDRLQCSPQGARWPPSRLNSCNGRGRPRWTPTTTDTWSEARSTTRRRRRSCSAWAASAPRSPVTCGPPMRSTTPSNSRGSGGYDEWAASGYEECRGRDQVVARAGNPDRGPPCRRSLERLRACAQHRPRSSRRAPAARHPAAQGATPQRRRRREV